MLDNDDSDEEPVLPELVTSDYGVNDQLLYFTSNSVTDDNHVLFFLSDRSGSPNVYAQDLRDDSVTQLSKNDRGTLKSYVYFYGNEYSGLSKASVSADTMNHRVYYIQDGTLVRSDFGGGSRVLNVLSDDQVTAFTHVSADGRYLCVPTTDRRALESNSIHTQANSETRVAQADLSEELKIQARPPYDIDERVRSEGLSSYLQVFDTETGDRVLCERVRGAWITHVQFHPRSPELILYNHEWPSDCGVRRMWLWDGTRHTQLRSEGNGRNRRDWTSHEMWDLNGEYVIYHGKYSNGVAYIGRVSLSGDDICEIELSEAYQAYGHFIPARMQCDLLVSDGYYSERSDSKLPEHGEWISVVRVDWNSKRIEWTPICLSRSSWNCQDSHPHPVFGPGDRSVYFTSDMHGTRAIYRAEIPE